MKKILVISAVTTILLSACGNQNLLPLEEKSTDLSDKNHEIKLENQELKNDINKKEKQLKSLNIDKKNTDQAKKNQKISGYLDASSEYYNEVTNIIKDYNRIDQEVIKNKKDKDIVERLDVLIEDHKSAIDSYKMTLDKEIIKKGEQLKAQDKDIQKLQQDINKAFMSIQTGYKKEKKEEIQKGREMLMNLQIKTEKDKQTNY